MAFTLQHIAHSYSSAPVLKDVSVTIKKGTVHALLGMNGAGKSTLMKIAAGDFPPVAGVLSIDGAPVSFQSPNEAKQAGISFVAQEVDHALVPTLSVLENVLLDQLAQHKKLPFSRKKWETKAKQFLSLVDADLNIHKQISECSLHEKQLILIARALSNQAAYLLFDEPTASLGPKETEHFTSLINMLKKQGVGILFISHRLSEIRKLADAVTVLRDGEAILSSPVAAVTDQEIVEAMTGKQSFGIERTVRILQTPYALEVNNITVRNGAPSLSLNVRTGETVVVYGLVGSGKTSLAETLFGARNPYNATVHGKNLRITNPRQAIRAQLAFVPEERRKQGLFLTESIRNHLSLHFTGWKRNKQEEKHAEQIIADFGIRPADSLASVQSLSGGNQQKVSIAKWAGFQPDVFILDEPTKGIDVSAKQDIFGFIEKITNDGAAVLYFTGEQDEALRIADRILVLRKGEIIAELLPHETTEEELLQLSEGGITVGTNS
ncbi:sugar ABC transporter ATP-binding protein [Ectobacillus panaciterrae]|uniref:sugar ABC transporter ATP-binding protein n=1 Tax=Ectobacillus panaciterrae TaxID=363872 RepID=UPI00041B299C|nr:sugar ABC transporter ATP-binding protein [Ectobacillus panaciterrae]